jgi:hypothetical protein
MTTVYLENTVCFEISETDSRDTRWRLWIRNKALPYNVTSVSDFSHHLWVGGRVPAANVSLNYPAYNNWWALTDGVKE